jgi:outer membrane protein, heavy metal efflux system
MNNTRFIAFQFFRSHWCLRIGCQRLELTIAIGLVAVAALVRPVSGQAATPLTLRQVLDSVSSHHPLVQAAQARVRAARGAGMTAALFGNPVFAYEVDNAQLPGAPMPAMEREVMTTGTFPLEPLYQRGPRKRRADAELRAAEADANAERQRVALDASRAFYRVAVAQVGLEAARDLASWLDTVVAYNRARVQEGVAAEADLIRSELERDRAAADATMQEADAVRSRAALAAFIGDSSVAMSTLVVAIDDNPLPLPSDAVQSAMSLSQASRPSAPIEAAASIDASASVASRMIRRAIASRPELIAARERLAGAGAGVATERSMLLRQLGLTLGTKQSAGTTSLIAGVSLPFPIFDQNRGEIARATAEREAAQFELAAQERTVRAEVSGAYHAARLLTDRANSLALKSTGYLARADEARRIALGAYREGAVPLIQVLDAARAWGDARVAYYRTLYAQHESVLELVVARGDDILTVLRPPINPRDAGGTMNPAREENR